MNLKQHHVYGLLLIAMGFGIMVFGVLQLTDFAMATYKAFEAIDVSLTQPIHDAMEEVAAPILACLVVPGITLAYLGECVFRGNLVMVKRTGSSPDHDAADAVSEGRA